MVTITTRSSFFKSQLFPLLLINFIGSLGYGVILPFLAFLVLDFGGTEVLYGVIAAMYPLLQMVGAPLLGRWSDKIGRKKVLLISQAGTLLSWLIFFLAFLFPVVKIFSISSESFGVIDLTLPLLVVILARAMDGLTGGNISVANAYLSDITPEPERKKNFGRMSSAMSLGFIIGPAIAGLLATFDNGNQLTIMVTMAISLFGLIAIWLWLPEVPIKKEVYPCPDAKMKKVFGVEYKECYDLEAGRSNSWSRVLAQAKAPLMVMLFFLIFLAFNLFYATFSMYSSTELAWSAQKVGFFFTLLSGVMIIGQGPVLQVLSRRFTEEQLFALGALTMVGTFSCLTSQNPAILYLGAVLFGLGNGIMWPSYLTMLSKVGSPDTQGSLQGIANGTGSFASILGLVFGGFLLALWSEKVYFLSAALLLLIFFIGIINMTRSKTSLGN